MTWKSVPVEDLKLVRDALDRAFGDAAITCKHGRGQVRERACQDTEEFRRLLDSVDSELDRRKRRTARFVG